MNEKNAPLVRGLKKEWRNNTLLSLVIYGVFFMIVTNLPFVTISWDLKFYLSIASSIFGTSYILTIRDPKNYLGFIFGITSSALLGVQLWMLGTYDQSILYFLVFVPFQIRSYLNWRKAALSTEEEKPLVLHFLPLGKSLLAFGLVVLFTAIDYWVLDSYLMPEASVFMKILCGFVVGTAIIANFLLINRWVDSWIYWVVYSAATVVYAVLLNIPFTILLFIFFVIINGSTGVKWIMMWRKQQKSRAIN